MTFMENRDVGQVITGSNSFTRAVAIDNLNLMLN